MCKGLVGKLIFLSIPTVIFIFGFHLPSAVAGSIEAKSSTGVLNSNGVTFLLGDGFAGAGQDHLVQCLYAGEN